MDRMIGLAPWYAPAATEWIASVHDAVTAFFTAADRGGAFIEDRWERPGGGGGVSRVLIEGTTFEKAGVNRSAVEGVLERGMASRLALTGVPPEGSRFFATGVSMVAHPRSPMVPTVHLNVRYFELTTPEGEVFDAWFGGGTDLTPTYPFPEDAVHFHRALAATCGRFRPELYPRYKTWCDEYFRNLHRDNEARGVGGVFFDHLRPGRDTGLTFDELQSFVDSIGRVLPVAYGPIVDARRALEYGERERRLQLFRRGRYAEFNLLHDRGTSFGLSSGARAESVLMSMPPLARWDYAPQFAPESIEHALQAMLIPRDWATFNNEAGA
jgi:coproporphyrinogen III oxidase